jgi:hypothetical protein
MMKSREEGRVFVSLADERIHFLFEGEIDPNADRAALCLRVRHGSPFVSRSHQARSAAAHDVTAHSSELRCQLLYAFVGNATRFQPGGPEDGDAIILPRRPPQPRQFVYHFPETGDGALDQCRSGVFVA